MIERRQMMRDMSLAGLRDVCIDTVHVLMCLIALLPSLIMMCVRIIILLPHLLFHLNYLVHQLLWLLYHNQQHQ